MASPSVRPRLPATVIALGLTSLFTDIGTEMIFPLLPVFLASLGASPTFLGLVEGLADATAALLKLGSGIIADRVPQKKPLVLFGYGLASAVRPLVALASAPWHVLAVRVADRIGKGVRTAPRDVLIASAVADGQAGRAFGFHQAMDHAGAVLGPLLATTLLYFGWPLRHIFWVAVIPGALAVWMVATVREPAKPVSAAVKPDRAPGRIPLSLRSCLAILVLFALGNSSDAFLLLRAKDLGVPVAQLPLLWMVLSLSKMASAYVGGAWSDKVPRHRLIAAGWLVYAVTYLGLGAATVAWQAWALFVVYGVYYGLTEPCEKALIKDLTPPEVRGRAFGLYHFLVGTSAVPAGLLTGWLWQDFGAQVALQTGAAIAGVAAVALGVWGVAVRGPLRVGVDHG